MNSPVSFHIVGKPTKNFPSASLENGERVRAVVVRRADNGMYILRIKGRMYQVRSEIALKPGLELRLRVAKNGDSVQLTREQALSRGGTGVAPGVADRRNSSVITALIRSGMSVLPESTSAIHRVLERYRRNDSFFIRLVTLLVDKGIEPNDTLIDELLRVFEHSESEARENPAEAFGDGGASDSDRNDREPADDEEDEDEDEMVRTLKLQCEAQGLNDGALHLFNHTVGAHDSWQIVPYRVQNGDWDAQGTIRIRRNHTGEYHGFVLEVREGGNVEYFGVRKIGDRFVAVIPADNVENRSARAQLVEKLRNLGIDTDDSKYDESFDGFSDESTDGLAGAVDAFV